MLVETMRSKETEWTRTKEEDVKREREALENAMHERERDRAREKDKLKSRISQRDEEIARLQGQITHLQGIEQKLHSAEAKVRVFFHL